MIRLSYFYGLTYSDRQRENLIITGYLKQQKKWRILSVIFLSQRLTF